MECSLGVISHFWLLNQWRYNQVQKMVLHRYLLIFSLGLWSDFIKQFLKIFFSFKKLKICTQMAHALFLTSNSNFYIFSNF
jgi:hypothetical protein